MPWLDKQVSRLIQGASSVVTWSPGEGIVLEVLRRYPANIGHTNRARLLARRDAGSIENQFNDVAS